MRLAFTRVALVLGLCAGCGSGPPKNPFPGNHALRVINASGFDCDVSIGKRLPSVTVPGGRVFRQIPVGGVGVIRLERGLEYEITARCGLNGSIGSLRTVIRVGNATDVVVVTNYPKSQQAAWNPEHGGNALQFGLYRPTPEAPAGGGISPCEAECHERFGECRSRDPANTKSEHCLNERNACDEACPR